MVTAYLVVTLLAIAANAFSGVAALAHFQPIIPGMVKAGVPESWLTFPIGTLKTTGAVGLLLGPVGVPLVGTAAAIGLVLFFVCAIYTHVRARLLAAVRLGGRVPLAGRGRADIGNGLALSGSSIPALVPSSVMSLSTEQVDSRLPERLRNSVGVASIGLSVQVAQATPTSLKRLLGLTGYTILQAKSLAAAAEMAKGCPVLSSGGSVEVLPVM